MDESQRTEVERGAPSEPSPRPYGFASRILDIFIEPAKVFDFLRDRGDFWRPFLFHFVVLSIFTYVALPATKAVTAQYTSMLGRPGSPEPGITDYVTAPINTAISLAIGFLVIGFIVWLAALISAGKARYGQALSLAAYTYFPVLLGKIINAATIVLVKPTLGDPMAMTVAMAPVYNYTSLAQFIGNSPILQTALLPAGIFTLWALYLLVIGLRRSAGTGAGAAWGTALILLLVQIGVYAGIAWSIGLALKAAGAQ